jgi:hypothetical protein
MLPVSLDCLCFFASYCAPYVASFSGLSLVFSFVLCTLCCQFLWIVLWFFPSYCVPYVRTLTLSTLDSINWQHRVHNTKEKTTTQSRETGNIGYIIRRKKPKTIQRNWQHRVHNTKQKNKDNPEKLAT